MRTFGFALKGLIYFSKPVDGPTHENLAFDIVFELVKHFANTMRSCYKSIFHLANACSALLGSESDYSPRGTIKISREEVPNCLLDVKARELHSSLSLYDQDNNFFLCLCVPKKARNVVILSSSRCET